MAMLVSFLADQQNVFHQYFHIQDLIAHLYDLGSPRRKFRVIDARNSSLIVECPEYLKVQNSTLTRLFQKNSCEKPPKFYVSSSHVQTMEIEHHEKLIMNNSEIKNFALKTACSTYITDTKVLFFEIENGDNRYNCNSSNTVSIWKRFSVLGMSNIYIEDSVSIEHSVLVPGLTEIASSTLTSLAKVTLRSSSSPSKRSTRRSRLDSTELLLPGCLNASSLPVCGYRVDALNI